MMWGGNVIAGKFALGHVSPFLLTSMRWLIAMVIILPFAWPHLKHEIPQVKSSLPYLAILGALGFSIFNNMMYLSLNYTSAINVGIIQASMPLIVYLLNFLLFGLRVSFQQMLGFLITLIGVAVITSQGQLFTLFNRSVNFGDLLMLIGIFLYGVYSVGLVKKPKMHWMTFISILGVSAFIFSLPFAFWEWQSQRIIWPDTQGYLVILYTAAFPAIAAQVFWMLGLEKIGSNRGGIFINILPIFSSAFAIILLGEKFHTYHMMALMLVMGGVALAQKSANSTPS